MSCPRRCIAPRPVAQFANATSKFQALQLANLYRMLLAAGMCGIGRLAWIRIQKVFRLLISTLRFSRASNPST